MKNYIVEFEVNGGEYVENVFIKNVENVEKVFYNAVKVNGNIEIVFGEKIVEVDVVGG